MLIQFIKMHGAGNDFVVLDNRDTLLPLAQLDFRKLADRQFGIGCDQIVVLEPSQHADVLMRIINADGSEVASCGNASRCIGWLINVEDGRQHVTIETAAGIITAEITDEHHVTVDMGIPKFNWQDIPLAEERDPLHLGIEAGELRDPVGVSMGNPHAVFFVPNAYDVALGTLGPQLEHHPLFPERANISAAHIESTTFIMLRVWERGAGLTLACGTAACATLVAAHLRGLTQRKAVVSLPGGDLIIDWRESDSHVLMTGPAAISFVGTFDVESYRL